MNLFIFVAETQPIFKFGLKDSASRKENKKSLLFFYPEAQPIFKFGLNDSASRAQLKLKKYVSLYRSGRPPQGGA